MALALALPGATAVAAQLDDVVKTQPDQNIDQQYGRDSVYAFSPDSKPLKPEQTAARDRQRGTIDEASGFPSALRPMSNDPMDNDAATDMKPTDARAQGISMGSGYTGKEWQAVTAMDSGSPYMSGSDQSQYEQRVLVILPGMILAPTASADEDAASSEFVIIVPSNDEHQSASLDEEGGVVAE